MRYSWSFLVVLFFTVLGCRPSKTVVSQPENLRAKNQFTYYDAENKISYHLSHDNTHLFVRLRSEDRLAVMKMVGAGLTLYFDEKGRRGKDTYFEYPLTSQGNMRPENMRNQQEQEPGKRMETLLNQISPEANFVQNDRLERIDVTQNGDIQARISPGDRNSVVYELAMPISRIADNIQELKSTSIGIISGSMGSQNSNRGGMPNGARSGGGMRPGGGGGMRPGGGMQGGGPGGMSGSRPNIQNMTQPIELWMRIDLKQS